MIKYFALVIALAGPSIGLAKSSVPKLDSQRTVFVDNVIAFQNSAPVIKALQAFAAQAEAHKNTDAITIVIDSPGGSAMVGGMFLTEMENLKALGVTVNCVVPGMAASMGFWMLAHCSNRYALSHAQLLFHRGRIVTGSQPLTAPVLITLAKGLFDLDNQQIADFEKFMPMDKETMMYHLENETMHTAKGLNELTHGNFITVVDTYPGLSQLREKSADLPALSNTPLGIGFKRLLDGLTDYLQF